MYPVSRSGPGKEIEMAKSKTILERKRINCKIIETGAEIVS